MKFIKVVRCYPKQGEPSVWVERGYELIPVRKISAVRDKGAIRFIHFVPDMTSRDSLFGMYVSNSLDDIEAQLNSD